MRLSKKLAEFAMLVLLGALLLLCYGVVNVHCVHENRTDLDALLDLKHGVTSDPNGALSSWSTNIHYCRWNHVLCTQTRPWRVSGLNLTSQGLAGKISSSLGNLTFLNMLDLSYNSFVGSIPILNRLQQLKILFLNNNFLNGYIPDELTNCTNLTNLDISANLLSGAIPMNIGLLSNLIGLSLSTNNLTGVIPSSLGHITTLQGLYLAQNELEGSIPNEIWQLPIIGELLLGQNQLSGGIPQNLPNMSFLTRLGLEHNNLGNALPANIGDALPNLQVLTLGQNMFEGDIPASLGKALGIQRIDLPSNNFNGQIPTIFGKLSNLIFLNLEGNMLEANGSKSWEFLNELGRCKSLQVLSLSDNHLQGSVPDSIGNLSTNLTNLLLGGNKLSGIIPSSITNLHGLINLALDRNSFTGTTEWIEKLKNLQNLNLEANKFTGVIPPSIGNLGHLTILKLGKNAFTGSLSQSLANLNQLLILNLSYNNFQGDIPSELGQLNQLTLLDLSSNELYGGIPETLSQCKNLATLRLDHNVFTGNISSSFGNLKSLDVLNLSHNSLSGTIPPSLSDLTLLSKLDLSYNSLQGQVPRNGVFENSTIVSLGGNPGLCGGAVDLHMPPCHHAASRRVKNTLVKVLIPIFGFMSLILLAYFLLVMKKMPKKTRLPLHSYGQHFPKVGYADLAQATKDFSESNLIGRGSHGSVYRGKLKGSALEVAVKVFNLEMRGAERSFMAECEALRSIQHRNLLPIVTACSTVDNIGNVFKALIYEFMPNGNLDTWLHHKGDGKHSKWLSLFQRISIAVNIADALDYIHHDCGRPTIHRDLKPSNILINEDMNALLGDFGISCLYPDSWLISMGSTTSASVKGTIGYIPPEYGGGGHPSTSGDVYSFGIVLLEIMTGKRPTDETFNEGLHIVSFVENSFPDQIYHAIDGHLMEACTTMTQEKAVTENEIYQCLVSLLHVALSCTRSVPNERLNMKQVASKMHEIKTSYLGCTEKKYVSEE